MHATTAGQTVRRWMPWRRHSMARAAVVLAPTGTAAPSALLERALSAFAERAEQRRRGYPPPIGGCQMFPADNVLNTRIDTLLAHAMSNACVNTNEAKTALGVRLRERPLGRRADWHSVHDGRRQPATYQHHLRLRRRERSRAISHPAQRPRCQGGGDQHVLVVDRDHCTLAEVYDSTKLSDTSWTGGSGAIFDLNSNTLRPSGWTSADAAGLPMLPGLARYDEVAAGEIAHALRFTAPQSQKAFDPSGSATRPDRAPTRICPPWAPASASSPP